MRVTGVTAVTAPAPRPAPSPPGGALLEGGLALGRLGEVLLYPTVEALAELGAFRVLERERLAERLSTFSPREILQEPPEEADWIIEDLITTGLHLLVGPLKAGKSWLALDMAISVAQGESFLGSQPRSPTCSTSLSRTRATA